MARLSNGAIVERADKSETDDPISYSNFAFHVSVLTSAARLAMMPTTR
jgi:hypothetical protein